MQITAGRRYCTTCVALYLLPLRLCRALKVNPRSAQLRQGDNSLSPLRSPSQSPLDQLAHRTNHLVPLS